MKHEKEHIGTYVCMHGGPREYTEVGPKCMLCGDLNPNKEHLDGHKIQECGTEVPGSFCCKRRVDMVRHLKKCHNVPEKARGEAVADKWRKTTDQQMWSCGFCIHLFHTFGTRLNHIAVHFEHGATLDQWNASKVIEGLLEQPRMASAWKRQLAAFPLGWDRRGITWEKHLVKDLQKHLEVGPSDTKPAEALAKAAYQACQYRGHSLIDEDPFLLAPAHELQSLNAVIPSSNYHSITERNPMPNSNHASSQYIADPAKALHYDNFALDGPLKTSSNYATFPASPSDGGSNAVERSRLHNPGQTCTSAADQYTDFNGYQAHSNAAIRSHYGPTPPEFSNEPNFDEMCE